MEGSSQPAPPPRSGLPGARAALLLLLAINLFNYIDRQVLAAVLPKLEARFTPDDPYAKTKMGALTTAFMVAYMVLAPLFGWMGDRMSRWLLVGVGVILWSLASGASGLAMTYLMLLVTRCFVGVGEAAYGPVAPGIISDLYPVERRGSVLAWFYVAIPVGSALGYVIGGLIADTAWGWRGAFLVVVLPGILLGLLAFRMPEPARGQADAVAAGAAPRSWRDYRVLWHTRSYVLDTLGMTAMTFVLGGIGAFMPTYVYQREARFALTSEVLSNLAGPGTKVGTLDPALPPDVVARLRPLADGSVRTYTDFDRRLSELLDPDERRLYTLRVMEAAQTADSPGLSSIAVTFGAIVVVSGLVATLLGGIVGDRLRGRIPGSYFLVSGVAMLLGFPFLLSVLYVPFPLAWVLVFATTFCLFFNTGPTNTILANVTHPGIRSTAFAINIFVIHALGDAISPAIIGAVADLSDLGNAFLLVSFLLPVSGLFWLWGTRYLAADTARAPTRL